MKKINMFLLSLFLFVISCFANSDSLIFKRKKNFEISAFPSLYINNFTAGYAWQSKPKVEHVIYGNLFFSLLSPIYSIRGIYQRNWYFREFKKSSLYMPLWGGLRAGVSIPIEEINGSNFLISSFGSGIGLKLKYHDKEKWKFEFDAGGAFGLMTKNFVSVYPFGILKEYNKPFIYPSVRLKIFWILNL